MTVSAAADVPSPTGKTYGTVNGQNTPRTTWNPLAAFGLALSVFFAAFAAAQSLPESVAKRYPWAEQAVAQGLTALVALGAMAASRRTFADFGFRRPTATKGRFKLWGLLLGAVSSGVILTLGLRGLQKETAGYGLLGIVLWIWVVSSVVEEIFCRGWFQTLVSGSGGSDPQGEGTRAPVLWSAALFGTMHLPLLLGEIDVAAGVVIVASVTALGYVCATARARTGSLRPAVAAHVLFNVGGVLAGVIYVIAYRVATGHLPAV